MANNPSPIITYTEILARAIGSVDNEIDEWRQRCANLPQAQADSIFSASTKELKDKLEALKNLYFFETGKKYC